MQAADSGPPTGEGESDASSASAARTTTIETKTALATLAALGANLQTGYRRRPLVVLAFSPA